MLARDECGVRPLHVLHSDAGLIAASEIWPLVGCLEGPLEIDREAFAHLLAFQFLPPGRTLFRSIASVRPGEALLYDGNARAVGRETIRFAGRGSGEADLGRALREAAALQGPREFRAAVFLSGGIDSSAVAGLLAEVGPSSRSRDHRLVPGRRSRAGREAARARRRGRARDPAARSPDPRRRRARGDAGARARARRAARRTGGLAQLLLARAAAEEGVRIVYSGEGGDELFGGYERHRLLQEIEAKAALDPHARVPAARAQDGGRPGSRSPRRSSAAAT